MIWVAAVAAALGAVVVAVLMLTGGPDRVAVAERYARAYARGDFTAMYAELTPTARGRVGAARFAALHRERLATATGQRLAIAGPLVEGEGGIVRVPYTLRTRAFGRVALTAALPVVEDGDAVGIDFKRNLAFPGLRAGEEMTRRLELPPRATLLSRDRAVLAQGQARTPDPEVADVAPEVVGRVGPAPPERAARLMQLGIPEGAQVGLSGLERALDERLLGTPGGELLLGGRVVARSEPVQAPSVRSTIAPAVVRAAVTGLAGRLGGVVAADPRTGEVLGYAGIAFSGLQPPGSTFKILTLTAALEAGIAGVGSTYPVATEAVLEGVSLENANGESCGGTLARSFALSCNSVFAPLGAELGPVQLVEVAERFGFNGAPLLPGAAVAVIPAAQDIGDDLAVGSSAIGQGRVQATALQMAAVAATIAERGARPQLTLDLDAARRVPRPPAVRVTTPAVAGTVEKLMQGVVTSGTGVAAAIPGVSVAGKTGTAELRTTRRCEVAPAGDGVPVNPEACTDASDTTDTSAWFTAFAPAGRQPARAAVGVLLVSAGAGGETAAPVAKQVLQAALSR